MYQGTLLQMSQGTSPYFVSWKIYQVKSTGCGYINQIQEVGGKILMSQGILLQMSQGTSQYFVSWKIYQVISTLTLIRLLYIKLIKERLYK